MSIEEDNSTAPPRNGNASRIYTQLFATANDRLINYCTIQPRVEEQRGRRGGRKRRRRRGDDLDAHTSVDVVRCMNACIQPIEERRQ